MKGICSLFRGRGTKMYKAVFRIRFILASRIRIRFEQKISQKYGKITTKSTKITRISNLKKCTYFLTHIYIICSLVKKIKNHFFKHYIDWKLTYDPDDESDPYRNEKDPNTDIDCWNLVEQLVKPVGKSNKAKVGYRWLTSTVCGIFDLFWFWI